MPGTPCLMMIIKTQNNLSKNKTYWFKRHPVIALVSFSIFGCIFVIILAELSARIIFPEWHPMREERVKFWRYDELLGWAHNPGQRGRLNHIDFSVEVVINSDGLRDDEYSLERNSKKRMLILGDSYGWGYGVNHDERFSEILERNHSVWEIINASMSGYGTDQQLLYLKQKGIFYKPDVVLLLFHENDFENNIHKEQYWYYKPYFIFENRTLRLKNKPVPKATLKQKIDRFFYGRTYLGKKISIYKTYQFINYFDSVLGRNENAKTPSNLPKRQNKYIVTKYLIKALNKLSKENGARFIIVSTPMNKKRRSFLYDVTREEGIAFLSLYSTFRKIKERVLFPHDYHWNALGHEVAAKEIDEFLQRERVF